VGRSKKMLAHVAWCCLFISGYPGTILPATAQQAAPPASVISSPGLKPPLVAKAGQPPDLTELPDSPGAVLSKSEGSAQQQNGTTSTPPTAQPVQSQSQQSQKPVGTAASEAPDARGIAASQPAGVAIAPAKQRRTRTIILRMGAIIGAGVAVGIRGRAYLGYFE